MIRFIYVILILVFSTGIIEVNKSPKTSLNLDLMETSTRDRAHASNQIRKWVQFKKVGLFDQAETLPFSNCYIEIEGIQYRYYREGELLVEDTVAINKHFKFKVFNLVNNPGDIIQFLDKKDSIILLIRNNFDGLHEYFVKSN